MQTMPSLISQVQLQEPSICHHMARHGNLEEIDLGTPARAGEGFAIILLSKLLPDHQLPFRCICLAFFGS